VELMETYGKSISLPWRLDGSLLLLEVELMETSALFQDRIDDLEHESLLLLEVELMETVQAYM